MFRRPSPWVLMLVASVLVAADWPGRERELAAQLVGASPARRSELLTEIASAGGRAGEDIVVQGLQDPDGSVRMTAAELVTRHHFARARDTLVTWLSDPQPDVRAAGARALGAVGDAAAVPALVRLLGDADVRVRLHAVQSIAAIGGPEATVPLLDRLADAESSVRTATARALGELGDARAVLSLLGALQDSMPEVREATATALGRLHDARAVRGLLGLLRDPSADVRVAATRALGTLGSPDAVVDLAPIALREDHTGDATSRAQMARAAIEAIGHIGGGAAAEVLVRAFRASAGDPELARAASDALEALGPEAQNHVEALTAASPQPVPPTQLAELLGAIGGATSADQLIALLETPDGARASDSILRALGRTGAPRALGALLRAAAATDLERRTVSETMATALARRAEIRRRAALAGLETYATLHGGLDPGALDPLVEILRALPDGLPPDDVHEVMATIARLIGETHNPRGPRVLAPLMASSHEDVRAAATRALARIGVRGAERELAAALQDDAGEVRLGAADALGRHGDHTALEALYTLWTSPRPIDRANVARAIGRIAGRTHDAAASARLVRAIDGASPSLAAALVDALAYAASGGDLEALAAIETALSRPGLATTAVEALSNAASGAEPALRARLFTRIDDLAQHAIEPAVRAAAVWALGRADGARQSILLAAIGAPESQVSANAAGALARMFARGIAPDAHAREIVCGALATRRHPSVRANLLLASARGGFACDRELVRRIVLDGRTTFVRSAAARALGATLAGDTGESLRSARTALELCARTDRSVDVAARCREVLTRANASASPPPGTSSGAPSDDDADDTIDVMVVGSDEEHPAVAAPMALVMADGVQRLGVTGPSGWVRERPAPRGSFTVLDPETQPLEP